MVSASFIYLGLSVHTMMCCRYWAIPGTISPVMEAVNGLSTGEIQVSAV
jgi:hypothetical protein